MYEDTPVLQVTVGSTMIMWARELLANGNKGVPTGVFLLREGGVICWMPNDDLTHEHAAWFPTKDEGGDRETDVRYVFVFRWLRGVRRYDQESHVNVSGDGWEGVYEDFV